MNSNSSSTLYFTDNSSLNLLPSIVTTLTFTDIEENIDNYNSIYTQTKEITDISSVIVGTDITKLMNEVFSDCTNLNSITIYNTDNLSYIGNDIFKDICGNGVYYFYSRNNYYTSTINQLISLLPRDLMTGQVTWTNGLDVSYNYYTDFSILCNDLNIDVENTQNYYLKPIDISYQDFHTLFFSSNSYLILNKNSKNNPITINDFNRYTIINQQSENIYIGNSTSYDISFNLLSKVLMHYQYYIPKQCWGIESSICLNKKISNIKTIFDFQNKTPPKKKYCGCKENNNGGCHEKDTCHPNQQKCGCKPPVRITINDFFNMFEAQGVVMAIDNSFNSIPKTAIGLPIDSDKIYTAILSLYFKSNNQEVTNLCIKIPYAINFQDSMPKTSVIPNTNNYRYNPYYTGP